MNPDSAILRIKNVTKKFSQLKALNDVSFSLYRGEITGIAGPNGAGKSTLINVIDGVYTPNAGKVYFADEDITGLKPEKICQKGIARTFQIPHLFIKMTVLENIISGAFYVERGSGLGFNKAEETALKTLEFIKFPFEKKDLIAGTLNVNEMKIIELARALATKPRVLLLDEPAAGLNPTEVLEMISLIKKIAKSGVTIIVIDHNMKFIIDLVDRLIILHYGEKIADGKPTEVTRDENVIKAYLGESYVFG
jgi:branched-chain amino acid transport system ATP-binding protein